MDYLEKNMDWLKEKLAPLEKGVCFGLMWESAEAV